MPGLQRQRKETGRSVNNGPPGSWRPSQRVKRPRVKQVRLPLSFSLRLLITFRRFRTNPDRRSVRYWQKVFWFNLFSFREIAIAKVPKQAWRMYANARYTQQPHRALRWALPVLLAIMVNLGFYYHSTSSKSVIPNISVHKAVASAAPKPQPPKSMPRSVPVRLVIPKIGVDKELLPLGRYPDGTIEMPSWPSIPGWYKYGPTPGEIGPAVIAGHLDTWTAPAVFWRLHELKIGDEVDVLRADGTTAKFSVTGMKQLPRDSFPTQEVYGNINYAGIRLLTCGGTFNPKTMRYSDNTVVYGKLE